MEAQRSFSGEASVEAVKLNNYRKPKAKMCCTWH